MEQNVYNICFVCTGNACRSPFAEVVLKALVAEEPDLKVDVWSCGTLDWGKNPRDAQMVAVAKSIGYTMDGETAYMTRDELIKADVIIVFSQEHRNKITRVLDYVLWDRIVLFDKLAFDKTTEVDDPHYQSVAFYERVAKHIEDGCKMIVAKLKGNLGR